VPIRGFYPTVTMRRVKGLLRRAGLGEQVATVMALLATEAPREEVVTHGKTHFVALGPRSLPQGAPTSPSITNALCLRLDCRLSGLARKLGSRYTRYADDLTFSWHGAAKSQIGTLLRGAGMIVRAEGFEIHTKKTRVMRAGARQKVTGLIVNQVPAEQPAARVPRKIQRELRAAIRNRELGRPGSRAHHPCGSWHGKTKHSTKPQSLGHVLNVSAPAQTPSPQKPQSPGHAHGSSTALQMPSPQNPQSSGHDPTSSLKLQTPSPHGGQSSGHVDAFSVLSQTPLPHAMSFAGQNPFT